MQENEKYKYWGRFKELEYLNKLHERLGDKKFDSLTEDEQREQAGIIYLADLLMEIYEPQIEKE